MDLNNASTNCCWSRSGSGSGSGRRRSKRYNYFETYLYYQHVIGFVFLVILVSISNFGTNGDTSDQLTTKSDNSFLTHNSVIHSPNHKDSASSASSSFFDSTNVGNSHGGSTSSLEDNLRKELIKVQILQRLGLTEKPQVDLAHKISRDLVLETLRRTETLDDYESRDAGGGGPILSTNRFQHHRRHHNGSSRSSSSSSGEDSLTNFAKTSEIISFPEKGPTLNEETLLSFSFAGTNAFGVGVRVKKAHLWVKMDHTSPIGRKLGNSFYHPRSATLYVFQVQGNFTNMTRAPLSLHSQDVVLDMVISRSISLDSLGWQKLDVTSIVQNWYSNISRHKIRHGHGGSHHSTAGQDNGRNLKLTLLVDCSGCENKIHPITFTRQVVLPSSNRSETDSGNTNRTYSTHRSTTYFHANEIAEHQQQANISRLTHAAFESFPDELVDNDSTSSATTSSNNDHLDNLSEIPFLVLETEATSPNIKRSRRRALECSPRVKACCKQRFFISFAELGWQDWIIAPRGYYANYCRGQCGGVHRTPDTFLNYHTHVMEEYRRTAAGEVELNGITPCCAPTKFAAMSLIYFGPELNIIKRDLPKMIIEECGCP